MITRNFATSRLVLATNSIESRPMPTRAVSMAATTLSGGCRYRVRTCSSGGKVMIKKIGLALLMVIVTLLLIAAGYATSEGITTKADTPEAAVRSLYDHARGRDFRAAMRYIATASNT